MLSENIVKNKNQTTAAFMCILLKAFTIVLKKNTACLGLSTVIDLPTAIRNVCICDRRYLN